MGCQVFWLLVVHLLLVCSRHVSPARLFSLVDCVCRLPAVSLQLCVWPPAAFLRVRERGLACCKLPGKCCMVQSQRFAGSGLCRHHRYIHLWIAPCKLCHNTVAICLCMGTHLVYAMCGGGGGYPQQLLPRHAHAGLGFGFVAVVAQFISCVIQCCLLPDFRGLCSLMLLRFVCPTLQAEPGL